MIGDDDAGGVIMRDDDDGDGDHDDGTGY